MKSHKKNKISPSEKKVNKLKKSRGGESAPVCRKGI